MSNRGMTSAEIADLENDEKRLIYLVEFAFSTPLRLTSFRKAVTYGGHSYSSAGLIEIDDVSETIDPQPGDTTITIDGCDTDLISQALSEGLVGEQMAVGMFWVDDETEVVSGGVNITVFELTGVSYVENVGQRKARIQWHAASVWTDFDRVGGRFANSKDQQFFFSGDKFFDMIDDQRELKWGSIS